MKRLAALLTVLTLTGAPVAHAVCLAWCPSGTVAGSEACPHSVAHTLPVTVSGEDNTCTAFLAAGVFYTLERRATIDPPVAAMVAPDQGALVTTTLLVSAFASTPQTASRVSLVRVLRL